MQTPGNSPNGEDHITEHQLLTARLRYLSQQQKEIAEESDRIKRHLEDMYAQNQIPAKAAYDLQFTDGSVRQISISRQSTGTYFKVGENHEAEWKQMKERLEQHFLSQGKAAIVEKACSWVTREVKPKR